nr:hypothetical protein [Microbacterium pseudoresistens]
MREEVGDRPERPLVELDELRAQVFAQRGEGAEELGQPVGKHPHDDRAPIGLRPVTGDPALRDESVDDARRRGRRERQHPREIPDRDGVVAVHEVEALQIDRTHAEPRAEVMAEDGELQFELAIPIQHAPQRGVALIDVRYRFGHAFILAGSRDEARTISFAF